VTTPTPARKPDIPGETTHLEPGAHPPATETRTGAAVPGPRLDETTGTSGSEPRPDVEGTDVPVSSTPHTTGRHRRSSRSEQYVR
jgi:hypothetical protein